MNNVIGKIFVKHAADKFMFKFVAVAITQIRSS